MITEEQRTELHEAAKPLLKFINENCHPHVKVILTPITVEILSGDAFIEDPSFTRD